MMRRIVELEAGLISMAGFALWLAVGAAVRRNMFMLGRSVLVSPAFAGLLFAALGVAAILILRGPTAIRRAGPPDRVVVFVEGPLTLIVAVTLIRIANAWRIIGDVSPPDPVDSASGLPIVLTAVVNEYVFYPLTLVLLVGVVLMFERARRRANIGKR